MRLLISIAPSALSAFLPPRQPTRIAITRSSQWATSALPCNGPPSHPGQPRARATGCPSPTRPARSVPRPIEGGGARARGLARQDHLWGHRCPLWPTHHAHAPPVSRHRLTAFAGKQESCPLQRLGGWACISLVYKRLRRCGPLDQNAARAPRCMKTEQCRRRRLRVGVGWATRRRPARCVCSPVGRTRCPDHGSGRWPRPRRRGGCGSARGDAAPRPGGRRCATDARRTAPLRADPTPPDARGPATPGASSRRATGARRG